VWRAADPIISVVLDRFGRLDIPVNKAGVFIAAVPLTAAVRKSCRRVVVLVVPVP
jgi:hypothetical protein